MDPNLAIFWTTLRSITRWNLNILLRYEFFSYEKRTKSLLLRAKRAPATPNKQAGWTKSKSAQAPEQSINQNRLKIPHERSAEDFQPLYKNDGGTYGSSTSKVERMAQSIGGRERRWALLNRRDIGRSPCFYRRNRAHLRKSQEPFSDHTAGPETCYRQSNSKVRQHPYDVTCKSSNTGANFNCFTGRREWQDAMARVVG